MAVVRQVATVSRVSRVHVGNLARQSNEIKDFNCNSEMLSRPGYLWYCPYIVLMNYIDRTWISRMFLSLSPAPFAQRSHDLPLSPPLRQTPDQGHYFNIQQNRVGSGNILPLHIFVFSYMSSDVYLSSAPLVRGPIICWSYDDD